MSEGQPESHRGTLPDAIGPTELPSLNELLEATIKELREAAKLYSSGEHGGRAGAIHALKAITGFFMFFRTVESERLQVPTASLVNALMALDDNNVQPLLKPARHRGRARESEARQALKGMAVLTVQELRKRGFSQNEALRLVVKELSRVGIKPGRGSGNLTTRTIREWREARDADVGKRGTAAQTIEELETQKSILEAIRSASKEDATKLLLAMLAFTAKSLRADELT